MAAVIGSSTCFDSVSIFLLFLSPIVANERFGFLVTESGAGTTWSGNSRQNKLTPWSNDPVLDPHGEALYLHDHANGRFWSPLPARGRCVS